MRAGELELQAIAAQAGINWSATASLVILHQTGGPESRFSKYSRAKTQALNKSDKGKVDFFSRLEEKDGLSVPFINFVRKGPGAGQWSGYSFLWQLFNDYRARIGTTVPDPVAEERRLAERQQKLDKAKEERDTLLAAAAEQQKLEAVRVMEAYNAVKAAFDAAPLEDGTHPYAVTKQIADVFAHCNVRRVTMRDRGPTSQPTEFMAILWRT